MLDSIEKFLNSFMDPIKDLLLKDEHSALIVLIFFVGVAIFFFAYNALNKEK